MSNKPKSVKSKEQVRADQPIYSKPMWNSNDVFTINGYQLEQIANLASLYRPIISTVDELLQTGEIAGTVKTHFVYADGKDVPSADPRLARLKEEKEAEISKMRAQIEEYRKRIEDMQKSVEDSTETTVDPTAEIKSVEEMDAAKEEVENTPTAEAS